MSGADPLGPSDDGLQNERTTLAWVRTALAVLGCGALLAKQTSSIWAAAAVLAYASGAAGVMIYRSEHRHHVRDRALRAGDPVIALHHVLATAIAACILSVGGLVLVAS